MLDRYEIARRLREVGQLLVFRGENAFRARAYERGARAVEAIGDLERLVAERRLTEVPGIGAALAGQIAELHWTGSSAQLERLRAELPAGVLELVQIPNLTPKRIRALHDALGIESISDLEEALGSGRVAGVKGFGAKTAQRIADGLRQHRQREPRLLLLQAEPLAADLLAHLRAGPGVVRAEVAGGLRRFQEVVGDIQLVAASDQAAALLDHFARFSLVARVVAREAESCTAQLPSGVEARLQVAAADDADFAAAWLNATGSAAHLGRLEERARAQGLVLDRHGLRPGAGASPLELVSEEELYRRLGLPFIPPELREDAGEIEAALGGDSFADLVRLEDVRGMVHCHTLYSDGKNTIEEMARAAQAMGMEYLTITDHSPSAHYAGGLEIERLRAQWQETARVQARVAIELLRGTESDILADGTLDYPMDVLEQLDVIIASVHARMRLDAAHMTARLVTAMQQPVFKIWGHALGRLLERREPFACDVERVLEAAAGARAAVEINGDPHRLDLEPRWIRRARRRRVGFVLSTDAHSVGALANLRFAVGIARRGGVRRSEVLNALPASEFRRAVRPAA